MWKRIDTGDRRGRSSRSGRANRDQLAPRSRASGPGMVRREDDRAAALRAAGTEVVVGDLLELTDAMLRLR